MPFPTAVSRGVPVSSVAEPRLAAALEIAAIETALAEAGRTVLDELGAPFEAGEHYPPGEVWDTITHAQYYFHAHPEGDREPGERGHFHSFLGTAGMAPGMTPLVLPEMAMAPLGHGDLGTRRSRRDRGLFSHLVGVAVDGTGRPISLFTTNRWVTGETWYRAEDVVAMLPRFRFRADPGLADRWLAAVLRLLRAEIAALVMERDARVMAWRRHRSRHHHVFDDHRLETVSSRRIDFAATLAAALAHIG